MFTVAISRVHNLETNYIIGNRDEAKKVLVILLNMSNVLMKEVDRRLQILNVLNTSNEEIEINPF